MIQALSWPGNTSMPRIVPSTRGYQTIERAVALAIATASVRMRRIRASGANGWVAQANNITATGCDVRAYNPAGTEQGTATVHWHALGV